MNKKEFICELKNKLSILKKEEVNDIINEYSEHIDEKVKSGKSEKDAIDEFGDIDELVSGILDAYKIDKEYYKKNSILDDVFDDTKDVFNKIVKIISNGTGKDIIKLLAYILITIIICYILKLPFYIIETFVNKLFIGLPVSVYNVLSRCSSIIIYTLYIIFVFIVFIKVLKEKVINNFAIIEKTPKSSSKTKVKESVKKNKEIVNEKSSNDRTILDGIFDIFKLMFRIFAGFILFGVAVMLFGFSILFIISLYIYIKYDFGIGVSIMSVGSIVGSIWLVYILYKYIVKSKISFTKAFIMFCLSIILCGTGVGVFATEFNKFEYIDGHHEFVLKEEKEYSSNIINNIECVHCEKIDKIVNNDLKDDVFIVKTYSSDYFITYCDNYYENNLYCGTRYPNYDFYKIILNDVKNKKFYNYDDFRSFKLEVIANEKTFNKLKIEG